ARPGTRVVAVGAAGAPAMVESLRAGRPVAGGVVRTVADGIAVREPVPEALADLRGVVDDALLVSEAAILRALRLAHRHAGLVVEPAGAVGLAALVEFPGAFRGGFVGTVLSPSCAAAT
ncbi:MAG: pyridoxal-phosphate dependent enzyme, partial [Gemmataceae bacterium]|nr:pyridoxal-phosphate dependent enzyme [Gemmataceae bacterium]